MKIHLNKMIFFGYHGVQPEERSLGQRFVVNLTFETNPELDNSIHKLEDTVDYTSIYADLKNIMENKTFHLLENCANTILNHLLEKYDKIQTINVKIKKPSVPIKGILDSVEVEMERSKK